MDRLLRILIADDDPDSLRLVSRYVAEAGRRVLQAPDGERAIALLDEEPVDLVLTDLMMPGLDGISLTREVKRRNPQTPVLMMTAFASVASAVEAMKAGASDYIPKPINPEELRHKVDRALKELALQVEVVALKRSAVRSGSANELVGQSPSIRKVMNLVALVAARDVPVVLLGESGTGKEVVARTLHSASPRARGSFVVINCAAVPETLLESELFGYLRGAFTGAYGAKKGLFEEADGGTLFLDEIGDAPLSIQTKLLRALQEGEIRRLGSTRNTPVNVRVLAASNRDLKAAIAAGTFREDLYYRLSVVTLELPPLRERREDIPLLAEHFTRLYAPSLNAAVHGVGAGAVARLLSHPWPGNIRELENAIKRALVVARGDRIEEVDIQLGGESPEGGDGEAPGTVPTLARAEQRFLRGYFEQVLVRAEGNVSRAAQMAGISRKNVYEHLHRLSLDPGSYRGGR